MTDPTLPDERVQTGTSGGAVRTKFWAIGIGLAALLAVGAMAVLLFGGDDEAVADRPVVAYMSSIALATGEGDIADVVSGQSTADPLYTRLNQRFDLQPIDDLRRLEAMAPRALLLIQPRALGPEENVALDQWVRGGGRLVLLTDPALNRESRHPKGDPRAPIYTGLASPLLRHWGVDMTLPLDEAEAVVMRGLGDFQFDTSTPGAFVYYGKDAETTAPCRIKAEGFIALCDFGGGRATLIADADFIDPRFWDAGGWGSNDDGVQMLESQLEAMTAR